MCLKVECRMVPGAYSSQSRVNDVGNRGIFANERKKELVKFLKVLLESVPSSCGIWVFYHLFWKLFSNFFLSLCCECFMKYVSACRFLFARIQLAMLLVALFSSYNEWLYTVQKTYLIWLSVKCIVNKWKQRCHVIEILHISVNSVWTKNYIGLDAFA